MATPVRGQIVVYEDINMRGNYRVIFNEESDLRAVGLNDTVSSFVVVSGNWKFYQNINYDGQYAPTFGPGYYPNAAQAGIPNDQASSLRC